MSEGSLELAGATGGEGLRQERDRFVAFAFAAADLLMELDGELRIAFASGAAHALTGKQTDALRGTSILELVAPANRSFVRTVLSGLERGGRLAPVSIGLAAAEAPYAILGGCKLPGTKAVHVTLSRPVSTVRNEPLPEDRDEGTGLLRPERFAEVASAAVGDGPSCRLSFIGMSGLGSLRARAGADAAADLMQTIGRHLRARSLQGDAAARLGNEKFGVLHEGELDLAALSEQIVAVSKAIDPRGLGVRVDSATVDPKAAGVREEDAARILVYAINKVSNAQDGMTIKAMAQGLGATLGQAVGELRELRQDLGASRYSLAFQKIVTLSGRTLHHYEALMRFAPGVSPLQRITFAEQTGLVEELDIAVLNSAIAELRARAASQPALALAVNVSGRSLQSEAFRSQLRSTLVPQLASRLLLEITESAVIDQKKVVGDLVQDLRHRGFRICLDDFGAGAASFDYLNAFVVDFIKIDGKYVRGIAENKRDRALVKAMATLARKLGIEVIAEHVETTEQCAALLSLGVTLGQGYLFGAPGQLPS